MFEWVVNTSLKLVEHNLNIYFMLFEFKKIVFINFHFVAFTDDIFLYMQIYYVWILQRLVRNIKHNEIYTWCA